MDGEIQQIVIGQELIEDVGRDHDAPEAPRSANSRESARECVACAADDARRPGRALCLPAIRSRCGGKLPREGLKVSGVEIADEDFTLLAPIFIDRVDQIAAQMFRTVEVRNFARAQLRASANSVRAMSQCEK